MSSVEQPEWSYFTNFRQVATVALTDAPSVGILFELEDGTKANFALPVDDAKMLVVMLIETIDTSDGLHGSSSARSCAHRDSRNRRR